MAKQMSLSQAFEAAMVDAINRYVREVLKARGLLSQAAFAEHASGACLQAKYAIAQEWATKWAALFETTGSQSARTGQTDLGTAHELGGTS